MRPYHAVLAFSLFACTSLLGDFEVTNTSGPTIDGGGDDVSSPDATTCVECGGQCVDTQTDNAHCGACNKACVGGQQCTAGACACADNQAFCAGACVVADRQKCGPTCSTCAVDQICTTKCEQAPPAAFDETPRNPTGWVDADNKPLGFKVKVVPGSNVTYECRSYSIYDAGGGKRVVTATDPPFAACAGPNAPSPLVHLPKEDTLVPQGSYRTEMRYRSDTYLSPPVAFDYYVHHKLDRVPACPRAGQPADGPHFTDAQYFMAASAFVTANPGIDFTLTTSFPVPGADITTDDMVLRNPFLKFPFKSAQRYPHNTSWSATQFFDVTLYERSLRHQYTLNPSRSMLLIKRQYVAPAKDTTGVTHIPGARASMVSDCKQLVPIGTVYSRKAGPDGFNRGKKYLDCEAVILNSQGKALCLGPNQAGTAPVVLPVDTAPTPDNMNGTISGTYAAGATSVTVAPVNFNAAFHLNKWVQLPWRHSAANSPNSLEGKWYKVTAVSGNTLTITPGLREAITTSGLQYRLAYSGTDGMTTRFVIPTGYAKVLEKNKGSQSLVGFYGPSYGTKCVSGPACADGTTYLTYLPP